MRIGFFSLTEALVTLSAIMILLSLAMPSIKGAYEQAVILSCQNQVRHAYQLLDVYVDDHGGNVPRPGHVDLNGSKVTRHLTYVDLLGYHSGPVRRRAVGWGVLYANGYVDDPKSIYYCPSEPAAWEDSAHEFDPSVSWVSEEPGYVFSNYVYRLQGQDSWLWHEQWHRYRPEDAILSDATTVDTGRFPHWSKAHKEKGVNILYHDGRVKFYDYLEWLTRPMGFAQAYWDNRNSQYFFWRIADLRRRTD